MIFCERWRQTHFYWQSSRPLYDNFCRYEVLLFFDANIWFLMQIYDHEWNKEYCGVLEGCEWLIIFVELWYICDVDIWLVMQIYDLWCRYITDGECFGWMWIIVSINRIKRVGQMGQMENAGKLIVKSRMLDFSKNEHTCIIWKTYKSCVENVGKATIKL